jgi:hypothetical protein
MPVKKPYLSKTIIINAIMGVVGAVAAFVPGAAVVSQFITNHAAEIGMVWGLINIVLRLITKDKISLSE